MKPLLPIYYLIFLLLPTLSFAQILPPPATGTLNPCNYPNTTIYYSVPVTSTPKDQIIQGPCYIFATVAALESRALQSCMDVGDGFHEWSLYNTCVLKAKTGNAHIMITQAVDVALEEGVIGANNFAPIVENQIPNEDDKLVPGVGDFTCTTTFCSNPSGNRVFTYQANSESSCLDTNDESCDNPSECPQKAFDVFEPESEEPRYVVIPEQSEPTLPSCFSSLAFPLPEAYKPYSPELDHSLVYIDLGDPSDESQNLPASEKTRVLKYLLRNGYGCIAFFERWRDDLSHCIFIYGGDGVNWDYKDSWPGDAGLKSGQIDLDKLSGVYFIAGFMREKGVSTDCQSFSIQAEESQNPITYTVEGVGNAICEYNWQTSGGTILSGQGTSSISFQATGCTSSPITVSVDIVSPTNTCTISRTIQQPAPTTGLNIQGAFWEDPSQTACPDEEYVVSTQPVSDASYEWQFTNGQIIQTMSPHQLRFRTADISFGTLPLEVKVRSYNACGANPFEIITGTIDPNGTLCGGGGQLRTGGSSFSIQDRIIHWSGSYHQRQGATCSLINLNGKEVFRQRLEEMETSRSVSHLPAGVYILLLDGPHIFKREKILLQ
ncbi:MAG: hypothetical protein AAFW00_13995 [Bacteroidota bacterium]